MPSRRPPEAIALEQEFPGARWLAVRCTRELEEVGALVEAAVAAIPRRSGLSHAALNALAVIEGAGQPLLTGEVSARMHITSGSMTSLLDTLERKGYVVRSGDPDDRRRVLVDVTPAARAFLDEALPAVAQLATRIMESLGPQRQQLLLDTLADVRRAVADVPETLPAPSRRVPPAAS